MKLIQWFGKLFATAVLISLLSVFTTAYLVDQYVQAMLDKWNLSDVVRPSLNVTGLMSGLSSLDPFGEAGAGGPAGRSTEPMSGSDRSEPPRSETEQRPIVPKDALKVEAGSPGGIAAAEDEEAVPVMGQASSSSMIVMSAQEFNEKRKMMSDSDKMEIFTLLLQKLPQEQLQRMSEMLEDGITGEEMTEFEEVIHTYLQKEDVERLLLILNKY